MLKKLISVLTISTALVAPIASNAGLYDIFKGWGWNSISTGWLSTNSTNTSAAINYGVNIDVSKNIAGWSWSTNLGWVCFGATCPGNPPGAPATSWATFDDSVNPTQLRGWARIYSLYTLNPAGEEGWVSLNCSNTAVCGTSNYYAYVQLSDGYFRGWAWNRTSTGTGVGWIRFDPNYGVPQYTPGYQGSQGGVPWLQVLYGDLYTKGNISTPTPFATLFQQPNATYCLDKGPTSTISNFQQGQCAFPLSTNLNLPKTSTGYATTLGKIDLAGLAAGKYGTRIVVNNLDTQVPAALNGSVYEVTSFGTYPLSAKTYNNASGSSSGAGLIIVRGDLNINGNLLYQVSAITRLKQLSSLGIIVLDDGTGTRGNVNIASGVTSISANIYAEGVVSTGSTGVPATDAQLTINGVVVAKQIKFQRQYSGTINQPAEKIVYDGRIVANTPPGMNDFALSLPVISN